MGDDRTITVAHRSDGPCADGNSGMPVSLPVVELLTGRGFVTGKSGSGKSNSCSVIAEKLLDNGFGLLVVDIDGEYYGLKEEYEILHAGADEECDIQVTPDHAEKLATLALEQNVPIILDVSSFLDESEARELLTAIAKQLFVKAKKLKQPFLLLVEEIHEYIPENGSIDECGRMLIKIGKRGRKHGLGITGISQRPADVKKDFITQCDWMVWHRLTWNNDTKVVSRILDREYADAVEDLDDGEGFLMTDWSESVRRVQFHRKQTFDAGATPGLEDVDRPDLKSVSEDLVSELESISDSEAERADEIARLKEELDKKNSRIAELEQELQDARDLSRMADQFVGALVEEVEGAAPGRTEVERMRRRREYRKNGDPRQSAPGSNDDGAAASGGAATAGGSDGAAANGEVSVAGGSDGAADGEADTGFEAAMAAVADDGDDGPTTTADEWQSPPLDGDDGATAAGSGGASDDAASGASDDDVAAALEDEDDPEAAFAAAMEAVADDGGSPATGDSDDDAATGSGTGDSGSTTPADDGDAPSFPSFDEPADAPTVGEDVGGDAGEEPLAFSDADVPEFGFKTAEEAAAGRESASTAADDPAGVEGDGSITAAVNGAVAGGSDQPGVAAADRDGESDDAAIAAAVNEVDPAPEPPETESASVSTVRRTIRSLAPQSRRMLAYYHHQGPATPLDAHFVAGGNGDRTDAYAHNHELRTEGLIEHVGRGKYDTSLDERVAAATDGRLDADERAVFVSQIVSMLDVPSSDSA